MLQREDRKNSKNEIWVGLDPTRSCVFLPGYRKESWIDIRFYKNIF